MKLFETNHLFCYPWPQVASANWRKYPNDFSAHVLSVDVISRHIDHQNGVLRTERLLACKQSVPAWLCRLIGVSEVALFHEISELDPATREYKAYSTNLSFRNIFKLTELCVFRQDPFMPQEHTLFEQKAQITTEPLVNRLSSFVEDFAVKSFKSNAHRGRQGLEQVINIVREETERNLLVAKRFGVEVYQEASEVGASIKREIDEAFREASHVVDDSVFHKNNSKLGVSQ